MSGTPYVIAHDGRNRASWLLARQQMMGASDVPGLYGLSSFGSPMRIWADKSGFADPFTEAPYTLFGQVIEPAILDYFAHASERRVRRDGRLLRSKRYPWLSCTLDARQWLHSGALLGAVEAKSTIDDWSTELPIDVILQVQTQYIVTGYERIDVAWLERMSARMNHIHVPRSEQMCESIIEETYRFWTEHVVSGEPPETDASESCRLALQRIYPREEPGAIIDADELAQDKAKRMARLIKAAGKLGKQADAIKNELRGLLENAEYLRMPDGSGFAYRLEKDQSRVLRAITSVDKTIAKREKMVSAAKMAAA